MSRQYDDDNPLKDPLTPIRPHSSIPPFTPRTPMRRILFPPSNQTPTESPSTAVKDVVLPSGAHLIIRGVGAEKKNSDPVHIIKSTITEILAHNPTLPRVTVKPYPSRGEWTTTCYVHLDHSHLDRSEHEPRTDLLEAWMAKLAACNPKWNVAWSPAQSGKDKRMWVRFPDLSPDNGKQVEAQDKLLAWAKTMNYPVCSSFFNKGGITLSLAFPHHVDELIQRSPVSVKGFTDSLRVTPGRQIEIQNAFELIVIGDMSQYEDLDMLVERWLMEEFMDEGESTLAGARFPHGEQQAYVFHMTTWAATAKVLSARFQNDFTNTFAKHQIQPPQMLFKVNTDAVYRIQAPSLREDFANGATTMNKGMMTLARRLDDIEHVVKQNQQSLELSLSKVIETQTIQTNMIVNLENRVVNTQRALLAQSVETTLTRNLSEINTNLLTLQMNHLLERDPDKRAAITSMISTMEAQKATITNDVKQATIEFSAIVSAPLATSIPQIQEKIPAVPSGLRRRLSTEHGISEDEQGKKRRLSSTAEDTNMTEAMGSGEGHSHVRPKPCYTPGKLTVTDDGIPASMRNSQTTRPRPQSLFVGVFDTLRDLNGFRRSYKPPLCRYPRNTVDIKILLVLGLITVVLSLLPLAAATAPTTTTTFTTYAINANGLVQPVKLAHINKVIRTHRPHAFVIGETKTQSKLSKSLPFTEYDIYEEPGERAENHHIFKWGIVIGIRKDIQVIQRLTLSQLSMKGRVIALDLALPSSTGTCLQHRLIGGYAPWNPGDDDGTRPFWKDITDLCKTTKSSWSLTGDLNATISPNERHSGGQEARRQYLEFLQVANGFDLWSNYPNRTRLRDWTCRSTQNGNNAEGNIIDRAVSSTQTLTSSEIYVTDKYSDWIPSTDHRGIIARFNYSLPLETDATNDPIQNFARKRSSQPRIKMPLKRDKELYTLFQEAVDADIIAKSLIVKTVTDDESFILQYENLTNIITKTAAKIFGYTKPYVERPPDITNDRIQSIVSNIRSTGGALRHEKSGHVHHISPKAQLLHERAQRDLTKLKVPLTLIKFLTNQRRDLYRQLFAEKAKEIMVRAKDADKKRIYQGIRGSTKRMLQSSSYVPLPLVINDPNDQERLISDPAKVKAATREYFTELYDHTRIPPMPKPWLATKSILEVKERVADDKFQWPRMTSLPDFRAMIRRGNQRPSPGPDKWEKWTIKALSDNALELVLELHNYQVMNSCFPGNVKDTWLTTIYKKGLQTDLRNWRGLSFSNFLANSPMTWLNQNLIQYAADKHILPDTQVAAQPGVQTRDLMSYLAGIKCWAHRHKQPIFAIKRDQMKGFDYLSPDGFYDAICAYGLPESIIDLDRASQTDVRCFIHTAYGATIPITVSGVNKQGGPASQLKSTFTTSLGHYYLYDTLHDEEDALWITSASAKRADPHTDDAKLEFLVAMVEATDDTYIFTKSIPLLQKSTLLMERFQYAYGWLTQWSKSNAYVLSPEKDKLYPPTLTFESVTVEPGADPLTIKSHTIDLIKDEIDFLRTKVDDPTARFNQLKDFIDAFQFPTIIGRLPITIIRKIVSQNIVSRCRALLSLQPVTIPDAEQLDRMIIKKVHETLGFPFNPSTNIATLPVSKHGFGFPSISRINSSLAIDGLQRDLNHHIPSYRNMALITFTDWTCERGGCINPLESLGMNRDYTRHLKSIPSAWIVAQSAMRKTSLALKSTDQSEIMRGTISLTHTTNIVNQKLPPNERIVNGTTLLSLKKKNIRTLQDIGKWVIDKEGLIRISVRPPPFDKSWTAPAKANWTKVSEMITKYARMDDFVAGMPDLAIPRDTRHHRALKQIKALAYISDLQPSIASDGRTWASDGSMIPASAGITDPKTITGAATGRNSSLILRAAGRNVSILQGEQIGLIIALILSGDDQYVNETKQLLTDHLNSVRLIDDSKTLISQVSRLRYMNGRSYYRWILDLAATNHIPIKYTRGHSTDDTMESRMNDEADHLASSSQQWFKQLTEAPPPTFFMNDFTFYHDIDGWIESNISSYVDTRLALNTTRSLEIGNSHRMATWMHDDHPPPEFPYTQATSAHSAAVQLYARSGQLATADVLRKRKKIDDDQCRLGCDATETPHHLFVHCSQYDEWRGDAQQIIMEKLDLKVTAMEIDEPTKQRLENAAKSLFNDDPLIWPLHTTLYYLGQIPSVTKMLDNTNVTTMKKQRIKAHISSDWHTASIRLAGRIFGDFQK